MTSPVGETQLSGRFVERPRLLNELSAARELLTVVCAPAGSGKTTLIQRWLADTGLLDRTVWVTVRTREQDPQRFWRECLAALRELWGEPTEPVAFPGLAAIDDVLEEFHDRVSKLEEPLLLVVDDLHELRSQSALEELEALVSARHPFLRLVLITRQDPGMGLHRLRLAGQLLELRASDLRFTLEEARALFTSAEMELTPAAFERLYARTEGWAAGLRLAQLSLTGRPDPEEFIDQFSGSTRTVADYLFAEVFSLQTPDTQLLLTRTSILDEVPVELAEQLTELPNAGTLLLSLEDSGTFVTSLDPERTRFRYHQLFADLVRLRLRRSEPGLLKHLHRTAAAWWARHGEPVVAIRHAQAAEDWQMAARLLTDSAIPLGLAGQRQTIRALIDGFPAHTATDPEVAAETALATAMQHAMGSENASESLALAERHLVDIAPDRQWAAHLLLEISRLFNARLRGDFSEVEQTSKALDEWLTAPSPGQLVASTLDTQRFTMGLRAVALANIGQAAFWTGNNAGARRYLSQGAALSRELGWPSVQTICLGHLALAEALGSLSLAKEHAEEAQAIAAASDSLGTYWMAPVHTAFGIVAAQRGYLEEAEHHLTKGAEVSTSMTPPMMGLGLRLGVALSLLGRGRLDGAIAELASARALLDRIVEAERLPVGFHVAWIEAMLRARTGQPDAAEEVLEGVHPRWRSVGEYVVARAHVLAARGRDSEAIKALGSVIDGTAPARWPIGEIEALILAASLQRDRGEREQVQAIFERALGSATRSGVILPLLSTDAQALAAGHPPHATAHGGMVAEILGSSAEAARHTDVAPITEPLTESEQRVLNHLVTNLSAPEIGNQLDISTNTVKTHMRHIYSKLDAHSRTAAVRRARELGLLSQAHDSRGISARR